MKVLVIINELSDQSLPDELDVLDQARAVEDGLRALGHETGRAGFSLNLEKNTELIQAFAPDVIFNLVEAVGRKAELIHLAPALFESLAIPFTGTGSYAMYVTSNKLLAKEQFRHLDIPTATWYHTGSISRPGIDRRYILKPVWEDGSVGISDRSVIPGSHKTVREFFSSRSYRNMMLEEYIHGREFNLSVLAGPKGPEVMPPAEIKYLDFPEGKPHILGYESKWDEGSFEYRNTPRSFEFGKDDIPLLETLENISVQCWHGLELRGYARVDFRVDESNRPFVLEVNANPCISPDAGFMAACRKAGLGYPQVIERILNDTKR